MPFTICSQEKCTGCAGCFNICPKKCISMVEDAEGFLRPAIDTERCDDCGACLRTCPILHPPGPNPSSSSQVYACWNKDDVTRFQSASGGLFSAFALAILDKGGVVYGAAFDENMRLEHIAVERKEDLGKLRSSKYVQSDIGQSYAEVRKHLREKRQVLFSGTPCQIAALYNYLGKDNESLLTCDIVCKGVPSPGLFAKYVRFLEKHFGSKLSGINMRDKRHGWNIATTVVSFDDGKECVLTGFFNSFVYGFAKNFTLRRGCYQCLHTNSSRQGDITLGDFWRIGELSPFNHSTRNGVSLILANSEKGKVFFSECSQNIFADERTIVEALYKRSNMKHPAKMPENRSQFFVDYQRLDYEELAKVHLVDKGMKGMIKRLIPPSWIFFLRKFNS